MKLIGMLDSPYVRRVAIALQLLGLKFEHHSLSVFRTFEQFREINPVVKAPTLVCDDGTVLMDSGLIIDYAQALAPERRLWPADLPDLQHELRLVGLAMAACEKSVQIVYEHSVRPAQKLHAPWLQRVTGQAQDAYAALEALVARHAPPVASDTLTQAGIITAVAWHFTQQTVPDAVPAERFPALAAFSRQAEALAEFRAAPHGDGTYRG